MQVAWTTKRVLLNASVAKYMASLLWVAVLLTQPALQFAGPLADPPVPSCGEVGSGESGVWQIENSGILLARDVKLHNTTRQHRCPVPSVAWRWMPTNASLPLFDAAKTCETLKSLSGGILVVGDSLSAEFAETLAVLMDAELHSWVEDFAKGPQDFQYSVCKNTFPLVFVRNDWLDVAPNHTISIIGSKNQTLCGSDDCCGWCGFWANSLFLSRFGVLVMNTGTHINPNFLSTIKETVELLRRFRFAGRIFYRNTVPGHSGCMNHSGPLNVSHTDAELVLERFPWYDGPRFKSLNTIAWRHFSSIDQHVCLLDAYTPTILRPDQHKNEWDCLHYCIPGPISTWVDLFGQLLSSKSACNRDTQSNITHTTVVGL
jgi:hypothetical protein